MKRLLVVVVVAFALLLSSCADPTPAPADYQAVCSDPESGMRVDDDSM